MPRKSDAIITINFLSSFSEALKKFSPVKQLANPVMLVAYISAWTFSLSVALQLLGSSYAPKEPLWFTLGSALGLWMIVFASNMAESLAEDLGRQQAESLRALRREVKAKRIHDPREMDEYDIIPASSLRQDDLVVVEEGDFIPADGQVIDGIASVDESAITGESAPVIRESGGEADAVTGGTRILSDWLIIRISSNPGEGFLDKMAVQIEASKRVKSHKEKILERKLLLCLALIFLCVALLFAGIHYSNISFNDFTFTHLEGIILFLCISPLIMSGLSSTLAIACMKHVLSEHVIVASSRVMEAASSVAQLIIDKTGTLTQGNRQAENFHPASGTDINTFVQAAMLASIQDQTPEGRSIVALSRKKYRLPRPEIPHDSTVIEFDPDIRISGIKLSSGQYILKGAPDAIIKRISNRTAPKDVQEKIAEVAHTGGTPLLLSDGDAILGVIHLKDTVKPAIKERLAELRQLGIKSVMITGDNPITAAAIAAEAGVDDYLAEATAESKLKLIRERQTNGYCVAMIGDGNNDAPALAQADIAIAMNSGTPAAKEAANIINLDSNPVKLVEIVKISRQLLQTRCAISVFSTCFSIGTLVVLASFLSLPIDATGTLHHFFHLSSLPRALVCALILQGLALFALTPIALKGTKYRLNAVNPPVSFMLCCFGIVGFLSPLIGIKLLDMVFKIAGII